MKKYRLFMIPLFQRSILGAMAAFLSAGIASAEVLFWHHGDTDPDSPAERWGPPVFGTTSPAPYSSNYTVEPVLDSGVKSWSVIDLSTAANSRIQYVSRDLTVLQKNHANNNGWSLKSRLRVVNTPDAVDGAIYMAYYSGTKAFQASFGSNSSGQAMVQLSGVGGSTWTASSGGYHDYELIYDPTTSSATLLVDGVAVISGYEGSALTTNSRVAWGSGNGAGTGISNWNLLEFSVVPSIGDRRELFVDDYLIQNLDGLSLKLHEPKDEGRVYTFNGTHEGPGSAYVTVINDPANGSSYPYRAYFRGMNINKFTSYAVSADGINWVRPSDNFLHPFPTSNEIRENFSPFVDNSPGTSSTHRYKAIGGMGGLWAFYSSDGLNWTEYNGGSPVITSAQIDACDFAKYPASHPTKAGLPNYYQLFDSMNVPFWSESENCYLIYLRIHFLDPYPAGTRRIIRAKSTDFINWTDFQLMEYDGPEMDHQQHYTSQTHPYYRAPHLYIATPGRHYQNRMGPGSTDHTADTAFMVTRGGNAYTRLFTGALVRPGLGANSWITRTNWVARGVVQTYQIDDLTGLPDTDKPEMSLYVSENFGTSDNHLRRMSLRLDGFASVHAPHTPSSQPEASMLTKPFIFTGNQLSLNMATSAGGGITVEVLNRSGDTVLLQSDELIGDTLDGRVFSGTDKTTLAGLAGTPVRLRFVMNEADLYSIRFLSEP
jgi:hypothetical protein